MDFVRVVPAQAESAGRGSSEYEIVDRRWIKSSNGERELRPVISTQLELGDEVWEAEFTLTNRDSMSYRMILGRSALRGRFTVDSGLSYLLSGGE